MIRTVIRAYRNKNIITGYGKVSLFGESKATLIRRSTTFLKGWVAKYLEHTAKTTPIESTNTRLVDMIYCQPCTGELSQAQCKAQIEDTGKSRQIYYHIRYNWSEQGGQEDRIKIRSWRRMDLRIHPFPKEKT